MNTPGLRKLYSLPFTFSERVEVQKNLEYLTKTLQAKKLSKLHSDIFSILSSRQDPQCRTAKVRQLLFCMRYPSFTLLRESLSRLIKKLKIPDDIRFHYTDFIEDNNYSLTLKFNSTEDIRQKLGKLGRLIRHPAFKKFFL